MDIENNDSLGDGDAADNVGDNMDELCAVAHQSIFTNNVALLYYLSFLQYWQHQFCHQ